MAIRRLYTVIASVCIAAAASIFIAGPASAEPAPSSADLRDNAAAAAAAADQAFRDADWAAVLLALDEFDAAYDELVSQRDAAAAALSSSTDEADELHALFIAARDETRRLKDIRDELKALVDAAKDRLAAAEAEVPAAAQALSDAQDDLADAQGAFDSADSAYHAYVADLLGAPWWWTSVVSEPVTVRDLIDDIDDAHEDIARVEGELALAQAELNAKQALLDDALAALAAEPLFSAAWIAAAEVANDAREARNEARATRNGLGLELAGLQLWLGVLDRAASDGRILAYDRRDAFVDAAAALEQAEADLTAAEQRVSDADVELAEATSELDRLRGELRDARDAFNAQKVLRDEARAAWEAALAEQGDAQALFDTLDGYVSGLADAAQNVADRKADLEDLATVRSVVVWTMGADNPTPRAGDSVTINFSIPNSNLFPLNDAQVTVVSPSGVSPTCDIPGDGIVPAGAVVNCSAVYVPTDDDAEAGQVTFEVLLSGWIALGPGNPRAAAATQTMIVVSQSISMDVAARPRLATDTSGALADTGLEDNHLPLAITLLLTGVALLVVRRRLTA